MLADSLLDVDTPPRCEYESTVRPIRRVSTLREVPMLELATETITTAHRVAQEDVVSVTGHPAMTTGALTRIVEQACERAVAARLVHGTTTIGDGLTLRQRSVALLDDTVTVTCTTTGSSSGGYTFDVTVVGAGGIVAEARHDRRVVDDDVAGRGAMPALTPDPARAARDLDRWGYCLLAGPMRADDVRVVRERLVEQAAAEVALGLATFDTGAHPSRRDGVGVNQRLNHLVNKGEEFHAVALNKAVGTVLRHALGERFLLTGFAANITAPGCELQVLHQDQGYVNRPHPRYAVVANALWLLDDVSVRNGGTRVVPGSHLWDEAIDSRREVDEVTIEAPAGTVAIVDGRTWHGAGANRSDGRRHVLIANYCRVWLRQQENPFLGTAPEVEASLSPEMRRLLGYRTWGTLGGVREPGAIVDGFVRRPATFTTRLS
jgi:ectoine hydroxylase-related dioxygenase (phytanoyl-CoA dioxygenase family)/predicted thioesterase